MKLLIVFVLVFLAALAMAEPQYGRGRGRGGRGYGGRGRGGYGGRGRGGYGGRGRGGYGGYGGRGRGGYGGRYRGRREAVSVEDSAEQPTKAAENPALAVPPPMPSLIDLASYPSPIVTPYKSLEDTEDAAGVATAGLPQIYYTIL